MTRPPWFKVCLPTLVEVCSESGDFLVRQAAGDKLHGWDGPSFRACRLATLSRSRHGGHPIIEGMPWSAPSVQVASSALAREVGAVFRISPDGEELRVEAVFLCRHGRLRRRKIGVVTGEAAQPRQAGPSCRPHLTMPAKLMRELRHESRAGRRGTCPASSRSRPSPPASRSLHRLESSESPPASRPRVRRDR